uniref:Zinc finger CCHC domain-containing protein 7 n=1 Tax=Rhipicephalus pulchellus TaxID=72859 RepID=L7M7A4_RHIPC
MASRIWDDDEYSQSSRESDSDEPDSDLESFLYSALHYSTGEEVPSAGQDVPSAAPKASPVASDEGDVTIVDVVSPKIRNAGSCAVSAEELKCVSKKPKRKKRRLTAPALEEPGPSTSREVIVLSSDEDDDEVIIFDEDSQQNIALNVTETPRSRGAESDLWHVDAEDLYRNSRGFRYHNKEKAHCRKCDQMGHVAKFCRKKKFKVCFCCSDMGHDGARCPKRMCSRCYEQGHTVAECKETDVPSCTTCYAKGHPSSLCPDLWRRYHLTTDDGPIVRAPHKTRPSEERYCYNCARQGHYGHQCQQKKRGRPSTPFVVSYKDLYNPEPPPLVLRDAKRLFRANNKRKRKNGRTKGLQATECNGQAPQNGEPAGFHDQQTSQPDVVAVEGAAPPRMEGLRALECIGQAAQNGEQAGSNDQQTSQPDVVAVEGAAPPESNCSSEQVAEDSAPSAKQRKKARMKMPNPMSKKALRKRVRERNKQKRLSQIIKRKLFQGEKAQKTSVVDNASFYIPNMRYYRTYWDH